jgi:hypothetical protein
MGLLMWNRRDRRLTRTASIVRLMLFVSLTLGLSYVLWTMAHH